MKYQVIYEELRERLGDEDFDYEADPIEWTDPYYNHQN